MTGVLAVIGGGTATLLAIALIVMALSNRSMSGKIIGALERENDAYKKQVEAENKATAAESRAKTMEAERDQALAALAVREAKPATPETDRVKESDPDRPVSERARDLDRLLSGEDVPANPGPTASDR